MDHLSENTIPWPLISAALQGNLSREEDIALQQWMASSEQNRALFMQLKNTWHNELDDLPAYLQADETIGWNALHSKLAEQVAGQEDTQGIAIARVRTNRARLISMLSIAALLVIVTGFVIWYMKAGNNNYKTAIAEQQSVALADGTLIKLFPASSMEVPKNYNESGRKVILKEGEAFFEVRHREEMPFVVDLGIASVKDIGTSFRIKKTNDSIHIVVVAGVVEFRNNANDEVRLLKAGMQATLLLGPGNSSPLIVSDPAATPGQNQLRFINTILPEVIQQFEVAYNVQVILDSAIANKRFTGNLEGQSFEGAMEVLCQSLNIRLVNKNGMYYLKKE